VEPECDEPSIEVDVLAAAVGVPVQRDGATPVFWFCQAVAFAEGLSRRSTLDLDARRFRSTLWAGPHRCVEHVEVDDVRDVGCDPEAGRLVIRAPSVQLVLTRQGTISAVPLARAASRHARRSTGLPPSP
jgi:hypothetical protein